MSSKEYIKQAPQKVRVLLAAMPLIVMLLAAMPLAAGAAGNNEALNLLIEEAMLNNPELKSFRANVEALKERPDQVRALDDPRLGLAIANLPVDSFRFDQEPMTQKQVSLKQKIPFYGKLGLKGKIAEKETEIARQEYDEKRNQVVSQIKTAYFNLAYIRKSIDLTGKNRELLSDFIKTAETGYAVGKLKQQAIIRARLQLSNIIKKVLMLKKQEEVSEARLTALLGRGQRDEITISDIDSTLLSTNSEEAFKRALQSRPSLKKLNKVRDKAALSRDLAQKEFYPDFDLGVSYGQRDDTDTAKRADFFSAAVTINIPLWYRNKESRKVAEKTASARRASELYNSAKYDLQFRISSIYSEINQLDQEIDLIKTGLIPQITISYESALSEYKVKKTGFLDLIRNQIELYNYKLDYYRAITEREIKIAQLEATVGHKLF